MKFINPKDLDVALNVDVEIKVRGDLITVSPCNGRRALDPPKLICASMWLTLTVIVSDPGRGCREVADAELKSELPNISSSSDSFVTMLPFPTLMVPTRTESKSSDPATKATFNVLEFAEN